MPIKLPNLAEIQATQLIACGAVESKDKPFLKWLDKKRALVSSYTAGEHTYFVRAVTGGFSRHFHLECASSTSFAKPPKRTSTRKEIEALTERLDNLPIALRLKCFFLVPLASLSPTGVIRTLSVDTTAAGLSMKLTGGTLALSGSPIRSIEWNVGADGKLVKIMLESTQRKNLTEEYLIESARWSRSLFDVIVLAKEMAKNG